MRLYVYALVPHGLASRSLGTGLADEPLEVVSLGAVDAVVGEMEERPSFSPATLQAHEDVLRRIGAASDALLPLGFGAIIGDAVELRQGLAPRLEALAGVIERTRGCDQMTLRIHAASADLSRIGHALRPLVRAEKIDRRSHPPLFATLFHLVERSRIPDYRARIEALAASLAPAQLDVTGPWVPYAFTELG
jgi:hypothetical protein